MNNLRPLLVSMALALTAASSFAQPPKHPPEICRGLGGAEYDKCVVWVEADIASIKKSRADLRAKQIAFKPLPVVIVHPNKSRQNASLTYDGVGDRVVPAGSELQVSCHFRKPKEDEEFNKYAAGSCLLKYANLNPHWMDSGYYIHGGKQPDSWVGMDAQGFLDPEFVLMLDPVPASQIQPAQ